MPKIFPIRLEVEEIALGAVLRKLNEMPGIAKLHLDLARGGEGAGRKQLEHHASKKNGNAEQAVVKLLLAHGQMHIREITTALGGAKQRAYGATHQLRKKGLTEPGNGPGTHRLTRKAALQLQAAALPPALPAPHQVKHNPSGRAARGSGNAVLRSLLAQGPKSPADVRAALGEHGISPKSTSGVIDRAKRAGLIKKNGAGYALTAKGQKIEIEAPANG